MCHLPLRLSPAPHCTDAGINSITRSPHLGTCIALITNNTTTLLSYGVSAADVAEIYMSPTPYNDAFEELMDLRKFNCTHHRTAGMSFLPQDNRFILAFMAPSTPGACIPRWRTRLRGAWLLSVNGTPVHSITDVQQAFHSLSISWASSCALLFAHPKISHGLLNRGLPLFCRDQFTQLSINQLSNRWTPKLTPPPDLPMAPTWDIVIDGDIRNVVTKAMKLIREKLMKQDDWIEWNKSEHLQLNQYDKQFMFSNPVIAEDDSDIFHLVWTYVVKELDGRKKACCVCDGSTRSGQVRILDHTYANCVDRTGSRIFYAISAAENMLAYGADVSNTFAEAPSPKQGFFIYPDRAFHNWWVNKKGKPPIPHGHIIPVLGTMQGHPESPRLWEKHIDRILQDIGLTPTIHKPCIYSGLVLGKRVLFMWQVDDFAISAPSQRIANHLLDLIDDKLLIPMKQQGLVTLYNGLDILQTRDYIKMSCETYINRISNIHLAHDWMKAYLILDRPTPLPTTVQFLKTLQTDKGDPDEKSQQTLAKKMGFSYQSGIGELVYAMVCCRPDLSFATVKLSQNNTCLGIVHFDGVQHALKYLHQTCLEGLYYWRTTPRSKLESIPLPTILSMEHDLLQTQRQQHNALNAHGMSNADWASCLRS
jgi:hypothetical protein